MGWTVDDMRALGVEHVTKEAAADLDGTMATLVADPVYEFHPLGLCLRGGDRARRFYAQFFKEFYPLRDDYRLLSEWVSEQSVAQEYEICLRVDGQVECHRVLGILYAEGDKLGGERVWASEAFVRRMVGPLWDELEPIPPRG